MFQDKELTCNYPKPRNNKTLDKTNIFFQDEPINNKSPNKVKPQSPTSTLLHHNTTTPFNQQKVTAFKRLISQVRLSPTHISNLFSSEKDNPKEKKGIRTYNNERRQTEQDIPFQNPKSNPFKIKDTPLDNFYPIDDQPTPFRIKQQSIPDCKIDKLYSKKQLFKDVQSDIFNTNKEKLQMVQNEQKTQIYPAQYTWENSHEHDIAKVNEKVVFDQDYSKVRKQAENLSSALPQSQHKSPEKITIKNNTDIKRTNQNFSDIFGQEFGSQQRPKKVRSISPSMNWTQHDSVRNKIDIEENEDSLNKQSRKLYSDDFCGQHVLCEKSFKQIKRTDRGYQGNIIDVPKIITSDKTQYWKKNDQQYTGIYSWKNNYQKKK